MSDEVAAMKRVDAIIRQLVFEVGGSDTDDGDVLFRVTQLRPILDEALATSAEDERCTRTHVDPDSQHLLDIIDRLSAKTKEQAARVEQLERALREIADYRNNDAQLRALHIARAALSPEALTPPNEEGE